MKVGWTAGQSKIPTDPSNVTCNVSDGESRSTTDEKTRIKKERKRENYRFAVTEQA